LPPIDRFENALYWAPRLPAPKILSFPIATELQNATIDYWRQLSSPLPKLNFKSFNSSHPFFFPCLERVEAPQLVTDKRFVTLSRGIVPGTLFPPMVGEYSLAFFVAFDSPNVGEILTIDSSFFSLSLNATGLLLKWRDSETGAQEEAFSENVWRKNGWIQIAIRKWEQRIDVFADGKALMLQSAIVKIFGNNLHFQFGNDRLPLAVVSHAHYFNHIISDEQMGAHDKLISEKHWPKNVQLAKVASGDELREEQKTDVGILSLTGAAVAGVIFFLFSSLRQRSGAEVSKECAACAERKLREEKEAVIEEKTEPHKTAEEAEEKRVRLLFYYFIFFNLSFAQARKQRKKAEAKRRREEAALAEREEKKKTESERRELAEKAEVTAEKARIAETEKKVLRERLSDLQDKLAKLLAERSEHFLVCLLFFFFFNSMDSFVFKTAN
jgi:hypothetical protein